MTTPTTILISIAVYLICMLFLGFAFSGGKNADSDFIIGGRRVGYLATMGSLAASFRDGAGFVFWVGFGLTRGYSGMWILSGVAAALVAFAIVGPRVRQRAKTLDEITIGELLRARFGKASERTLSTVILIVALMVIAMQLLVAGKLFATVLGTSSLLGVSLVALIVMLYMLAGGYQTVVLTDVAQLAFIAVLVVIPFVYVPERQQTTVQTLNSIGLTDSASLMVLSFFVTIGSAENWQRVYSARNDRVIRFGFPLAVVALLCMNMSLVFIGMALSSYVDPAQSPESAFYAIFNLPIQPWLLAMLAVALLAACMSTLDTLGYLTASTLARNLLPARLSETPTRYIRLTRIIIACVLVLMSGVALSIDDIIRFMFETVSLIGILGPIYLAAAVGLPRRSSPFIDRAVALATVTSLLLFTAMFVRGDFASAPMLLVPPAVNAALTALVLVLGTRKTTPSLETRGHEARQDSTSA